jgi:hypothetical protein
VRRIPVSAERLWEIISRPGNLELAHPFCARNPVLARPTQPTPTIEELSSTTERNAPG